MAERRYMIMKLVAEDGGFTHWRAITAEGLSAFTRDQAEALVASHPYTQPRFPLQYTDQVKRFGEDPRPTFVMMPGETIWTTGKPARADMIGTLQIAMTAPGDRPSPDPERLPIPVPVVVEVAKETFGSAKEHDVEAAFDAFVMDLGGTRYDGDPPNYGVPLTALGLQ